jgi:amino acid transporter
MNHINKLLADVSYQTIEGPGIVPTTESGLQLESIISMVFGFLTIVGVIFFALQLIFAGYGFLSSQGEPDKLKVARTRLTNGILGLTIVVIAFGAGAFIANLLGIQYIFNLNEFIGSIKLTN